MKAETIFNKIFLGFDFPRLDWFPADLGPPRSGLILTAIEIPFIFTECDIDIDNDWLLITQIENKLILTIIDIINSWTLILLMVKLIDK